MPKLNGIRWDSMLFSVNAKILRGFLFCVEFIRISREAPNPGSAHLYTNSKEKGAKQTVANWLSITKSQTEGER